MIVRLIITAFLLHVAVHGALRAQGSVEPDIQKRLDLIKRGNIEQVRSELPSLLERYPGNPGVLYLQGVLTSDGGEAVRIFQKLVDGYPKSEWADDALYKIYQYYFALGLYRTADQKLEKLRQEYPQSPYLRSVQQQISMQPDLTKSTPEAGTSAAPSGGQIQQPAVPPVEVPKEKPAETRRASPESAPVSAPSVQPQRIQSAGGYTVQTGVFANRSNAEKFRSDLVQAGYGAEVRTRVINGREMYTVCIGAYGTYEEAQRFVQSLKEKDITGIVIGR